jgi:hypothetical protein
LAAANDASNDPSHGFAVGFWRRRP